MERRPYGRMVLVTSPVKSLASKTPSIFPRFEQAETNIITVRSSLPMRTNLCDLTQREQDFLPPSENIDQWNPRSVVKSLQELGGVHSLVQMFEREIDGSTGVSYLKETCHNDTERSCVAWNTNNIM